MPCNLQPAAAGVNSVNEGCDCMDWAVFSHDEEWVSRGREPRTMSGGEPSSIKRISSRRREAACSEWGAQCPRIITCSSCGVRFYVRICFFCCVVVVQINRKEEKIK